MSITDRLLLMCKNSTAVKLLFVDDNRIINILENTTNLKNAMALIDNLNPEQYVNTLSHVKSLEVAKYIVKKYTETGGVIDFSKVVREVPYYYHANPRIDLELNTYFIQMGGGPSCFNEEYLQELNAYKLGL